MPTIVRPDCTNFESEPLLDADRGPFTAPIDRQVTKCERALGMPEEIAAQNMGARAPKPRILTVRSEESDLPAPMNAEGRPTRRFFSILLGQSVALGEDAYHFRHVLVPQVHSGTIASARLRPSGVSA